MKSAHGAALLLTLLLAAGFPAFTNAAHAADASPASSPPSSAGPLLEEMQTLDKAFRNIVSAVAVGDSANVRAAVASMHGAMEKTHEGIHSGAVVLPRNAGRIKEFVRKDRKFHEKLEALDRAAGLNHQQEMLRITKLLLDGCVQCHSTFRKWPASGANTPPAR